eukprot:2910164-Prymnesium_polylepis.2
MTKLSSGKEMWQRRWFVLKGNMLMQYNSAGEVGGPAKWSLDLSGGAQAAPAGGEPARLELACGAD